MDRLYIARKPFFWYPQPGQPVSVVPGMVARQGHPVIEAEPSAWEPMRVTFEVKQEAPKKEPESKPESKPERGARRT